MHVSIRCLEAKHGVYKMPGGSMHVSIRCLEVKHACVYKMPGSKACMCL